MLIQLLSNDAQRVIQLISANTNEAQVVLLQNGIYAAHDILLVCKNVRCYALASDFNAAGLNIQENEALSALKLIDEAYWVELCGQYQPIITLQ